MLVVLVHSEHKLLYNFSIMKQLFLLTKYVAAEQFKPQSGLCKIWGVIQQRVFLVADA